MPTSHPEPEIILGIDMGGTKVQASLVTAEGKIISSHVAPTHARDGFAVSWAALRNVVDQCLLEGTSVRSSNFARIGLSIGGPVDSLEGIVYGPPNLPGWDTIPVRNLLESAYGVPCHVEHDAKAGALAEWTFGAAVGMSNVVFLTLGTGIGAGLIVDGRLLRGRRNNAGEVGHWRVAETGPDLYGKPGSWEGYSSGAGLAAAARMSDPLRWGPESSAAVVLEEAKKGQRDALALVDDFAAMLGKGIALLVDLLAPDVVVLGSLAVRAGDLFMPRVQAIVEKECTASNLPCPVLPSSLGESSGILAAVAAAVYQRPTSSGSTFVQSGEG